MIKNSGFLNKEFEQPIIAPSKSHSQEQDIESGCPESQNIFGYSSKQEESGIEGDGSY